MKKIKICLTTVLPKRLNAGIIWGLFDNLNLDAQRFF